MQQRVVLFVYLCQLCNLKLYNPWEGDLQENTWKHNACNAQSADSDLMGAWGPSAALGLFMYSQLQKASSRVRRMESGVAGQTFSQCLCLLPVW